MFQLTPLGSPQVVSGKPTIGTLVTVGTTPSVIYTCPAGKKAIINALSDQNVALGANTFQQLRVTIGGVTVNLRKMVALEAGSLSENINGMVLNAADKIDATGDNAGNNGTINFFLTVTELPA